MVTWQRIGICLAAAVMLASSGCGGSTHPSAASYVHTVCSAMRTFGTKVQAQANQLPALGQADAAKAKELQRATSSFLSHAQADGQEAVATINRLGSPDVANGAAIHATILGAFQQLTTSYGSEAQTVANLNSSKGTAFYKQLQEIGSSSQQLGYSINSTLQGKNGLGSSVLNAARSKDSVCSSLR